MSAREAAGDVGVLRLEDGKRAVGVAPAENGEEDATEALLLRLRPSGLQPHARKKKKVDRTASKTLQSYQCVNHSFYTPTSEHCT